jgi:cyclomaltodextrinase
MAIHTPDWVKHAVFYQIFPDRFARSPRTHHPHGIDFKPWGSPPEEQGFQGGDLRGIVDRLDYLEQLGVTALYLTPVFSSASNHRYHTFDYFQVDPLLGGDEALRELLDAAHARGMRVVLDGVFNHASRGFWPFHHVLENGGNSPYIDWFTIYDWPLRPYASDAENPPNYAAWWGLPALPKLNTDNPGVRDYLFDVARHWLEFGIDGWRLDVPHEIDDDAFWQEFRRIVKGVNPDAYICGEIWGPAQRWLQGDQFDAVMNYLFASPALCFFGASSIRSGYVKPHFPVEPIDAETFGARIEHMLRLYAWEVNLVQLNLLDSHDMARALWIMGDDKLALRLCALFQMTMPGAPCIYYGDEVGLSAADDPFCRAAFPWHDASLRDEALLDFYRRATALRHRFEVLRTGTAEELHAKGQVYAFVRRLGEQAAVVVFNAGTDAASVSLTVPGLASQTLAEVWPTGDHVPIPVVDAQLAVHVPPREALVLVSRGGA